MSMTDESEIKAPPAVPTKKKVKRKPQVRASVVKPAVAASPFEGISANNCCDRCNEKGCVISGREYCAHPFKGGLQAAQMNDSEALKRFNKAKDKLKNQQIELRGR
jgi:hypothetical protein